VIGLLITIGLPALIVYLIHARSRVPVSVPVLAAVFCAIGLAVSVPLNAYVWPLIFGSRSALGALLLSGITAGVCQEVARYASFRFPKVMRDHRDHAGALAAGVGHAGLLSVLAGLQFIAAIGIMIILPNKFPMDTLMQVLVHGGPQIVMHALSQVPQIACSLAFSLLIVLAFRRNRVFWPVAVAAHVGLLCLVGTLSYLWGQAVLSLAGGLSLLFTLYVIRTGIIAPPPVVDEPEPIDPGVRLS
jgi:uncharacterized membrane protein YhfC